MFYKVSVLKNFCKAHMKTSVPESPFNKVSGLFLRLTLIKTSVKKRFFIASFQLMLFYLGSDYIRETSILLGHLGLPKTNQV